MIDRRIDRSPALVNRLSKTFAPGYINCVPFFVASGLCDFRVSRLLVATAATARNARVRVQTSLYTYHRAIHLVFDMHIIDSHSILNINSVLGVPHIRSY